MNAYRSLPSMGRSAAVDGESTWLAAPARPVTGPPNQPAASTAQASAVQAAGWET
ncbi:hypothetical protein [Streptomyces sp. NBC_01304]|uniref:hypothetical protein n=1 Tax=Streptomyces sp. NBC_01304 TaxID=2903818 RepID=UPI002E0EA7A8|nr:hypothetical protein OG430_00540 [Streptomyces sp. NBC_01304]